MAILSAFYPDEYQDSTFTLDYRGLYDKGFRGIIYDIDNTLVPHGAPADGRAIRHFEALRKMGYRFCLISNNKEPRVASFAEDIGGAFYVYDAHKPSRKAYLEAVRKMGLTRSQVIFVGDQIFTDVYGAKRAGIYSILVKPIHPKEEIQIVLKRYLEKIVLFFYKSYKNGKNG
jgi:hypothetical protein